MSDESRQLCRLEIPPSYFMNTATKGVFFECLQGLPEDCEFRGMTINPDKNTINVFISHKSFMYVAEGMEVPQLDPIPTFRTYRGKELQVFKKFWDAAEKHRTDEIFNEEDDESPF